MPVTMSSVGKGGVMMPAKPPARDPNGVAYYVIHAVREGEHQYHKVRANGERNDPVARTVADGCYERQGGREMRRVNNDGSEVVVRVG